MKKKYWIVVAVLFVAVTSLWLVFKDYKKPVSEGRGAPSFSLKNQSGVQKRIEDFRGKVVLVNFWATWCGPCVSEMESLEKLYQKFNARGFEVVAISLDEKGWPAIDAFKQRTPLSFTVLLDPGMSVADSYGTYRIPESFLISRDGKIVEKIMGPHDWIEEKEWGDKIDKMLSSK